MVAFDEKLFDQEGRPIQDIMTNTKSDRFEFILKQNTKYLLEAVGANGDLITYLLDWYEHTNA